MKMTVKSLQEYKGGLTTGLNNNLNEFEKNFFLVAAGILAFSVTFIKDIVVLDHAVFLWLLFTSWILIAMAVGLIMLSFLLSVEYSHRVWKIVDQFLTLNNYFGPDRQLEDAEVQQIKSSILPVLDKSKKSLRGVRISASATFLAGVLCMLIFVALNTVVQKVQAEKQPSPAKDVTIRISKTGLSVDWSDSSSVK